MNLVSSLVGTTVLLMREDTAGTTYVADISLEYLFMWWELCLLLKLIHDGEKSIRDAFRLGNMQRSVQDVCRRRTCL